MANWAELLPDLLTTIVKKVYLYEDFIAFGGVCRTWRSIAVKANFYHRPLSSCWVQHPWLMLAEKETETHLREFVNLSKGGMSKKFELPEARGKWCVGSMGWLITLDQEGGMELLHPLTRARISLPHLKTYRLYEAELGYYGMAPTPYLHRAMLSASPSATDDYYVMLILGAKFYLAFWKPGNTGWTSVETGRKRFCDVTYHKNKFYAASIKHDIFVCDIQGPNPTTVKIVGTSRPPLAKYREGQLYLTEFRGELLLVKKFIWMIEGKYWTRVFKIFKAAVVSSTTSLSEWEEVNDLGGTSIFVGHNTPICVPSAVAVGLKPNCIYFTDDYVNGYWGRPIGGEDMGIYNLGSGAIEPFYHGTSLSKYCPPIWVSPSF